MFLDFLRTPAFGLDISDYSIEIISLKGSFQKPRLLAIGRKVLEPGAVQDTQILDREILKKTLSELIKLPKFGKIKTNKFIFSLPESKSFILTFELPKDLRKKEELEFIKSEVRTNLPFKIEDLYIDFKIREKAGTKEVLLVAAPKIIVNNYLEVFESLKLQPLAIEIESLSIARSLIREPNLTILIADIGARTTNFSIFDKNELRFSSTIEIAGNKFTKGLAEGLKISLDEAENLKIEVGLNPKIKEGKIFSILKKEIQAIILEIKNIEKYFQKKENKEFGKIILTGGSAVLPNLCNYLSKELEKPVIIGDPWAKINIDILKKKEYFKKALEINPILYATSIGSALRSLSPNPKKVDLNLMKELQ